MKTAALPRATFLRDSTAKVIEQGLRDLRWPKLPSERHLSEELKVSRNTVREAFSILKQKGLISCSSNGRSFYLGCDPDIDGQALPIDLILGHDYFLLNDDEHRLIEMILEAIPSFGYEVRNDLPILSTIKRDFGSLEAFFKSRPSSLRIVVKGNWDDLSWFSRDKAPVLAVGGRSLGLDVLSVGFDLAPGIREAMQFLTDLGHRRIVMCCRSFVRDAPVPGKMLQAFVDGLADVGVSPTPYHLPAWDDTAEGFRTVLEQLFRLTPPTAILIDSNLSFATLMSFCNRHGLRIPEHLSIVLLHDTRNLHWFHPNPAMVKTQPVGIILSSILEAIAAMQSQFHFENKLIPCPFVKGETIARPRGVKPAEIFRCIAE